MSRTTTLAIVHPVDKLQGSDDAVRTQVWAETTQLLILGFLRMLKYVWQRNKDILADLRGFCCCAEFDVNDIFDLSFVLLTEYICVDMPDDDSDDPYGDEFTRFILSEPELDEYLALIAKLEEVHFDTARCTGWNKLRDAVEMCCLISKLRGATAEEAARSIFGRHRSGMPPLSSPSLIDLMTYIGAEIDRMKAELAALTAAEQEMEVAA